MRHGNRDDTHPFRCVRAALAALALFLLGATGSAAQAVRVPEDHRTIMAALAAAGAGDTILIAPGTYRENVVLRGKAVTLASWFLTTGDPAYVQQTVIDGGGGNDSRVVQVDRAQTDPAVLIGLTLRNGDDCISSHGKFDLLHSRITGCTDGIDYQSGSAGVVRYSIFEGNEDDGIDFDEDIVVTVENNLIRNNDGDGIEIRLHPYDGPVLRSVIRGNAIIGNGEDGIQFIDYPEVTNREYVIENNHIVDNRQAGIGCMSDGISREDYRAAVIPEPIFLSGNYFQGNERNISCGHTVLSRNGIRLSRATSGRDVDPVAVFLTWRSDPSTTVTVDWHLLPGTDAPRVEIRGPGREGWAARFGEAIAFPFSDQSRRLRRRFLDGQVVDEYASTRAAVLAPAR